MRKIEQKMIQAVRSRRDWQSSNTRVDVVGDGHIIVRLHGHPIAELIQEDHVLWVRDCGWQTTTTKSRLNALLRAFCPGCGIYQKDWVWFLSRRDCDTEMERDAAYAVSL